MHIEKTPPKHQVSIIPLTHITSMTFGDHCNGIDMPHDIPKEAPTGVRELEKTSYLHERG